MGKLVAFRNHTRFENELNNNNINEYALNFIIDTGQLYTHGIYLNAVTFGADTNGSVDLTVANLTKSISLASHTHSNYLEKNSNIDIGSYKIVSGNNLLLSYSDSKLYLGDTDVPTYIKGSAYRDTYTILDTGNFSIENKTLSGNILSNVLLFTYGSNKVLLDYVKRLNTSSTFDNLASYTCLGTTNVDLKKYGFITFYSSEGTFNSPWALLRINIDDKNLEYRTSASTTWSSISTPNVPLNALNTAGIVAAPDYNSQNKVWKTDNLGNPAWRDETIYSFLPLTFQLNGTDLMTYNTLSAKTITAGTNISFSFLEDVLTINANSTIYGVVTKLTAGLCPVLPDEEDDSKFLRQDGTWALPTYTSDTNTWRPIKVNNTQLLGSLITSGDLEFINGSNTTVEWTLDNKLKINAVDTWNANAVGVAGYVAAPTKEANANMTWQTDANGVPAWRASNNHTHSYLPLSGGTLEGPLYIKLNSTATNYKLAFTADGEGGNITICAPDSYKMTKSTSTIRYYLIDAYNGNLRIYTETDGSSWASLNTSGSLSTSALGTLWGSSTFNPNDYLAKSGGTLTGSLILKGSTTDNMTYSGNAHPYIRFDNSDSSLNVSLIFTDYDSYRSPAGLKLVGNQGNEWFEAPAIYLNGTKVSVEGHTHSYLPLSGGTMTGMITTVTGLSHNGIKLGNTYLTSINGEVIFQNNTAIRFGGDSWDWNVWAELGYNHSSKIVYLGLAGSPYSANATQTGGTIYTPGISDIYIGNGTYKVWHAGNLDPLPNNSTWIPAVLTNAGMTRRFGFLYGTASMGWASNNTEMYVYTDGAFYQREGNYMCLDTGNYSSYALPLSGGTMTGNLSFSNSGTGFRGINYGTMGDNDQWRIGGAATASNAGYMEIATADDGNEPIYVRLYTGVFTTLKRTLTLLDASGNTSLPGTTTSSGTITASGGYLVSTLNGNTVTIGSANTSYMHFLNSANIPFWFNKDVRVLGELYVGSGYNQKVWHTGNFNPNNYHPLNGKITVGGRGYSWYNIQQYNSSDANPSYYNASCAIININSYGGWQPWIRCVDNENGSWALGQYTNFVTLIRYVKTNTGNVQGNYNWTFNGDGSLTASKFVGTLQGNCSGTASGLVDGSSKMTSAYNKAGLDYSAYTWLAGWNGYELRAVNKSLFALASHTHAYSQITDGTSTSTNSGWSRVLSNTYGGSQKSIFYTCHGGGYGAHLRGYSNSASVYMLEIYNDTRQVFVIYGDGHSVFGGNVSTGSYSITTGGVSASGTSNRLVFRHLDGLNCNGDYALYLQYHQSSSPIYFHGGTYRIASGGNTYFANYYTTSDRLKKQNISLFSEHIRKFQMKDTEKWHYGVIALEVPEIFRDGEEGNMTVNYNSILSYYVGLLENRVKELENRLAKYEEISKNYG